VKEVGDEEEEGGGLQARWGTALGRSKVACLHALRRRSADPNTQWTRN
jgi:hypothetical protein